MGKIRNFITILILMGLLLGCQPTSRVFKDAFSCYKDTIMEIPIKLKGYYSELEHIETNVGYPPNVKKVVDTIARNVVFYEDGVFLYSFYGEQFKGNNPIGYKGGVALWGGYSIYNDTLKGFFMTGPDSRPNRPWGYVWFKIIDKNTIREICFKWQEPITAADVFAFKNTRAKNISNATFIPSDSLPNPNLSWIKNKKWFWCDEQQFKLWKKAQKEK